ncbi:hypothetical protein BS78_03G099400 [Paspalum vaginatum]|nr:hypothetical protein BS78_03G099400 [Paspalum vaginatum]
MVSLKRLKGHTPFEDLSKTTVTNGDIISNLTGSTTSNVLPPLMDPRERKRQRERDRYAQLSSHKKDELLKRRREARRRKKVVATHINVEHNGQVGLSNLCKKNISTCQLYQMKMSHSIRKYGASKP